MEILDRDTLTAVEAGLWDQVQVEGGVVIVSCERQPCRGVDTRLVLADFYEEYGLGRGVEMADCLRWCVRKGCLCHRAWFNEGVYRQKDCNNLPVIVFTALRGSESGLYHKSGYCSFYHSTREAYEDLSQALVVVGR